VQRERIFGAFEMAELEDDRARTGWCCSIATGAYVWHYQATPGDESK